MTTSYKSVAHINEIFDRSLNRRKAYNMVVRRGSDEYQERIVQPDIRGPNAAHHSAEW